MKITIYAMIVLLLIPLSFASLGDNGQSFQNPGVDRQGTNQQGGVGNWHNITGQIYPVSLSSSDQYNTPVIMDLDNDGINEIIIQDSNYTRVYSRASSGYLQEEGSKLSDLYNLEVTPAVQVWNSTHGAVTVVNTTHFITHYYNGTAFDSTTVASFGYNLASTPYHTKVVCGPSSLWGDNDIHCFAPMQSGTVFYMTHANINDSLGNSVKTLLVNGFQEHHTIKIADTDTDGTTDVWFNYVNLGITPADVYGMRFVLNSSGHVINESSCVAKTGFNEVCIFDNNIGASHKDYTDMAILDLDGNLGDGYEIAYAYSTNGQDYYLRIYDGDGNLDDASFISVVYWIGDDDDTLARNLISWDSTGGLTTCHEDMAGNPTKQAAMVVHDTANFETKIICFSKQYGNSYETHEFSDYTEWVGSNNDVRIARLQGSTDFSLVTDSAIIDKDTGNIIRNMSGMEQTIPVDYDLNGFLDIVSMNGTVLHYHDDLLENDNVVISSFAWNTGNPPCNNSNVKYTLTVDDAQDDFRQCHMEVLYNNGTSLFNTSDTLSRIETRTFTYKYTSVDYFDLVFRCADQFADSNVSYVYETWTDVPPNCFGPGQGAGEDNVETVLEQEQNNNFDSSVDGTLSDIGIIGSKAKAMLWILIMIGAAFLVISVTKGMSGVPYIIATVQVLMLVLGWVLGFIGSAILVIVGFVVAAILTAMVFGRANQMT